MWLGVFISALFIWLAFRKINYHALWAAMKEADYLYLIPAVAINIFHFYLRSVRWGYLMEPVKRMNSYTLFSATTIGFMANNILPARIGEFVRAYAIGRRENVSISASFATIVVERILDTVTIFVFMLSVLYLVSLPPERAGVEQALRKGGGIVSILFILIMLLLLFFKNNKEFFIGLSERVIKPASLKVAKKFSDFLDSFASGLLVLGRGKHLLPIAFYSLAIWLLAAAPIHLILVSFGYLPPFSISVFILVILALAVAIPSAPGFIGTFHYACALGLELFGIPGEEALSVAIILHAINFFPVTIIGLFFLWRGKMSLAEAERLEGRMEGIE